MFFSGLFQRKSDAPVTTPAELADAIGLSYDTYIRHFCFLVSGEEQNVVVVIIVVHPVAAAGDWLHVITSWWKLLKRTAAGHAIFWRGNCVNH